MSQAEIVDDDAPFDPWSEYSLRDFVGDDLPEGNPMEGDIPTLEYHGFHLMHTGNGRCQAQYDGHADTVMTWQGSDYDDVLDLVADLNQLIIRLNEFDYQDDKEGLVEWAGKIMTSDKERADADPELYIHVPEHA